MARKLKPADPGTTGSVEIALGLLARARDELKSAGAGKSAEAVREAIKSAGGALRHARRRSGAEGAAKPGRINRCVILVEVLAESASPRKLGAELEELDLSQIGMAMDGGDMIGSSAIMGAANVPERGLSRKLKSIGCSDGGFFGKA